MIYSIVVGLIAGWLAGQVMKGGGYGVLVDINPRDPWWHRRRLGVRTARTPCGGINRFDYRVVCRRGDSGLDRAEVEKGVSKYFGGKKRVATAGNGSRQRGFLQIILGGNGVGLVRHQEPFDGRGALILQACTR